ncbi:MAG TPA: FAD-dependent oxidoreductase [Bacteroidetes bacterium]|nr:FAD-dependent oxidoreductase [Bacteroidota bacterium]
MENTKQILIVGGGLGGMFFAAESLLAGHEVTLVDAPAKDSASRIAAGLFNVITGRKAGRSWQAAELLEVLNSFFDHPQFQGLKKFLHPLPIYRTFKSIGEYNDWTVHSKDPTYNNWVRHIAEPRMPAQIHNELGGLEILPCGWLETGPFLDALKVVLQTEMGMKVHETTFEHAALNPDTGKVNLGGKNYVYDEVVFAEGVGIRNNPWFDWMVIWPLKGQILEVEIPNFDPGFVLMRKIFLLPKGNNFYTVGSTYEREFVETGPTAAGIAELKGLIQEAIKVPFRVVEARAGLRPTTPNRRPVLGTHPEYPRLHVLNGLGTKGVLQTPWSAQLLRKFLDGELAEMPKQLSPQRFLKKKS